MSTNRIGTMGVMVCRALGTPPIAEKEFLGKLSTTARKLGIHVFVFSPENSADESNNGSSSTTVQGYHYTKANGWIAGEYAVPDMVYDRCLHLNSKASANAANLLHRWKQHGTILWARGLPGKQRVHHVLKRSPIMRAYLPATLHYSGDESLRKALLAFRGSIFMKPSGGSHGRHTLQIQSLDHHTVSLQGRDRSNQMFQLTLPATEIYGWVQTFTNKRSFIIQPFLKLVSQDGSPFDIRSLVQKDERGTWSITGLAVRQGSNQA
ncbi:hypothetical protein JCM10914_1989 [Paenibacillus sp. JCM 10914]|nr:YheC/YheD family protein [Paenibacillus sp. JCM 10914]GAE05862.1 hypothetical protein JCM10914_1989 [Paenibacillus sp. JCM 10914]